jgi:cation diffusion facilitator CzcD-associated flavoprotein CzcO
MTVPASRKPRRVRVAIIGAGFGGIAAAVNLRKRTTAEFVIFEQAPSVGGTWWHNRYPGCEVDVHSHAYSFSFMRYDWAGTHATQAELLQYARDVVDRFGLRQHLRLGTAVTSVRWLDEQARYELRTAAGNTERFDAVISAVGLLSVPRIPDWPGLETFAGPTFHTAHWQPDIDLTGKRVAVVGTGSTAAQVVPAVAAQAARLYVFQREPGWVEPKLERPFSPAERWVYHNVPGAQKAHRAWLFYKAMQRGRAFDLTSRRQAERRAACVAFIQSAIADEQVRRSVTPSYPWGCKRVVLASTYYSALNRSNVELVPHAVTAVTHSGVVDDTGTERPVDVLVLSTGFQPTNFLATLAVTGLGGLGLHDAWRNRQSAYLGITVAGFPNFFILYGPNTNGAGSIIAQLERQAEFAARAIARMERGRWRYIDTDAAAQRSYVAWIDRQLAAHASAMDSGCTNYYHDAQGANITQWPASHLRYLLVVRVLGRRGLRPGGIAGPGSASFDDRADRDRHDDEGAADNVLPEVRDGEQVESVSDDAENQHTEDSAPHRADAAEDTAAAECHAGDREQRQ